MGTLARSPGYTITVFLTFALGIGGTAAVHSVLRSVILRPFPWAPADRVMMIADQDSAANVRVPSYPTFQGWRAGTDAFEALAFVRGQGAVLKSLQGAEPTGRRVRDRRVLPRAPRACGPRPHPGAGRLRAGSTGRCGQLVAALAAAVRRGAASRLRPGLWS